MFANEQHADADARVIDRAERLAMTASQMVRAAENRYGREYRLDHVYQGGIGWVEALTPTDDPQASPWVHLLPVGWTSGESGAAIRTYLVRGTGAQYGAPDWVESDNMREWLTSDRDDGESWATAVAP